MSLYSKLKTYHRIARQEGRIRAAEHTGLYKEEVKQETIEENIEELINMAKKKEVVSGATSTTEVGPVEETIVAEQISTAHDLVFDKEKRTWSLVSVEYSPSSVKSEVISPNQAIAIKRIHDLFTNKAIRGRK